jgi:hypothetical protein
MLANGSRRSLAEGRVAFRAIHASHLEDIRMKLTCSLTVAALALGSVIGLSNMAAASPLGAASGDAVRAAAQSDLIVQVQGNGKLRKNGGGGGNAANTGGGNRNAGGGRGGNRNAGGGRGGRNGAAAAAVGIGIIGGLIAADAANRNSNAVGVYEDDDDDVVYERPRVRCPYGSFIGRDGYRHCRR